MREYRGYGREEYGREEYGRRRRDSRGRYMEGDEYGRRGNFRNSGNYGHYPHEMMDRMAEGYEGYMEGMEEFRRGGNYGAKDEGMEALEYMLNSVVEFFEYIMSETDSQEEMELVKKYAKKIKEM